jgi:putative SOS response-associated peptidase YedK
MCGRFTLTDPDPRILRMRFDLDGSAEIEQQARFNVAPTDEVLAIRNNRERKREPGRLRWGLIPHYADPDKFDRLLINARAETVAEAPAFRDAFNDGFRCLIVADGFYEWQHTDEGKKPMWITRPEREPLYARSKREDGSKLYSCAIVTTTPGEVVRPIHDRMPVILDRGAEASWIDSDTPADEAQAMLEPTDDLEVTEVNDAVNNVREDGPHLLDPPLKLF